MTILDTIPDLAQVPGPVHLGIGVFDGLHAGHRAVIQSAHDLACAHGGSAVAVTFDPHPARTLRPDAAPHLLTSTPHKARLIATLGVAWMLKVRFDQTFAATEPEEFISALAKASNSLRSITVGHDWTFGRGRRGNVALLKSMGAQLGFDVVEIDAIRLDGEPISSTRIRRAVQSGHLSEAARLLGRPYSILGTVERGAAIGRTIGFPTANLRAHNEQFPPDGVWVVRGEIEGQPVSGVANIGVRPTVETGIAERKLEVHLFDWDRDIYGHDIEIEFLHHIRNEQKFESLDALKSQIARDTATAAEWLRQSRSDTPAD